MLPEIKKEKIEDLLFCETKPVLELKIEYPQVFGRIEGMCENRFNSYYLKNAAKTNLYVRTELYNKASVKYKNSTETGFPFDFMTFDRSFITSFNDGNYISLYFTTFKYEGGAHGMTTAKSETWNLQTREIIPLGSFFVKGFHYTKYISERIASQIKEDLKSRESVYYKNAPERSKRLFNEKRYYLSDTGFIFYYPTYSIAPYYAGIRIFEVPFEEFGNKLKYRPERML